MTTKPRTRRKGKLASCWRRTEFAGWRAADASRIAIICGVMLIGSFPPETPLDDVIAALPNLTELEWPRCFYEHWRWEDDHEDLTLWHGGRLLALISRGPDGDLVVRRFDRPT